MSCKFPMIHRMPCFILPGCERTAHSARCDQAFQECSGSHHLQHPSPHRCVFFFDSKKIDSQLTNCGITDDAFVDRADLKLYVGPPGHVARYEILRSTLDELIAKRLIVKPVRPLVFLERNRRAQLSDRGLMPQHLWISKKLRVWELVRRIPLMNFS